MSKALKRFPMAKPHKSLPMGMVDCHQQPVRWALQRVPQVQVDARVGLYLLGVVGGGGAKAKGLMLKARPSPSSHLQATPWDNPKVHLHLHRAALALPAVQRVPQVQGDAVFWGSIFSFYMFQERCRSNFC